MILQKIKEYGISALKTFIATGGAAVIAQLSGKMPVDTQEGVIISVAVTVLRLVLTFVLKKFGVA